MYVASGLGTNLGDLYAQYFALGLVASFLLTMIVSAILITADLKNGAKTETFFWVAIVIFRAGATNVGDFITHNLHVSYALASLVLAAATIAAGAATRPAAGGASPMIDLRYWGAMFIAGVFGTIFGDLVAHATTFFAAFLMLGAALALVIYARSSHRLSPRLHGSARLVVNPPPIRRGEACKPRKRPKAESPHALSQPSEPSRGRRSGGERKLCSARSSSSSSGRTASMSRTATSTGT
jgi:hypothetical protein